MENEKLNALIEGMELVLKSNDYICIDDFLVDRKIRFQIRISSC